MPVIFVRGREGLAARLAGHVIEIHTPGLSE